MKFVFKDILKIVPELGTLELSRLLLEIKKEFIKRGKILGERNE